MRIKQLLRYWQQMVNCRNPKCRYGCASNHETAPHGPYFYGDALNGGNKTRRVYIGTDLDEWLEAQNAERDVDDALELPVPNAGAAVNRAPRSKTKRAKKEPPAAPPDPRDVAAQSFMGSRPNARAAMAYLGIASPADLKPAFRKASKAAHPDSGGSVTRMMAVNLANGILAKWAKMPTH